VERKLNKWISALRNVDDIFRGTVLENQEEILDANTSQLEMGKDSLGNFLYDYASDAYAQFKIAHGSKAPLGTPDLKLEGNFYDGFVLKYEGKGIVITSTDEKTDKLIKKYGGDIFGLADEQLDILKPQLIASFTRLFRAATN